MWAPPGSQLNVALIGEVAVWRAANGIYPNDPRPTGPAQLQTASPSGNTTSTDLSPAAPTTTAVVLTSQSTRLLQPHMIAGTTIDSGCPNLP